MNKLGPCNMFWNRQFWTYRGWPYTKMGKILPAVHRCCHNQSNCIIWQHTMMRNVVQKFVTHTETLRQTNTADTGQNGLYSEVLLIFMGILIFEVTFLFEAVFLFLWLSALWRLPSFFGSSSFLRFSSSLCSLHSRGHFHFWGRHNFCPVLAKWLLKCCHNKVGCSNKCK